MTGTEESDLYAGWQTSEVAKVQMELKRSSIAHLAPIT